MASSMIDFDDAIGHIRDAAVPVGKETVAIAAAAGRVLAAPVVARIDSPRADVSSMDGYAVRDADAAPGSRLSLIGHSYPGSGWSGTMGAGQCVRIFTGAPLPDGADRVVMQEMVRREGDEAVIEACAGESRFVRPRGCDFRVGDELLTAGRLLNPRAIVAAAAADLGQVEVYRRPRLALLTTGDELVEPGRSVHQAAAVPDSVAPGVAAIAGQWGAEVLPAARLPDELSVMEAATAEAVAEAELVVVVGGASVGEKDHARAMFAAAGLKLIFAGVAIRPGKPVWFGRAGPALVVGLPGNPTSAMVTARMILAPLLAGLTGRAVEAALDWRPVPLRSPLSEGDNRQTFHRARWRDGGAEILGFQDSCAQRALADADLLVRQPIDGPALKIGEAVEALEF